MSTLTLFSAFLPSVHDVKVDWALAVTIIFITLRIVIGFFVGGLWPTAVIFANEKRYNIHGNFDGSDGSFEEFTKKRTKASAIMQSGFHTGHLIAALLSLGFLAFPIHIPMWHTHSYFYFSFKDASTWRMLSLIGGLFGIIWTLCFRYLERKADPRPLPSGLLSESPLKALITNRENKAFAFSRFDRLRARVLERVNPSYPRGLAALTQLKNPRPQPTSRILNSSSLPNGIEAKAPVNIAFTTAR
jgi:MFS family permease